MNDPSLDALLSEASSLSFSAAPRRSTSPSPSLLPSSTVARDGGGGDVGGTPTPGMIAGKLYPVVTLSGMNRTICFGVVGKNGHASFCIRDRNNCATKSHVDAKVGFAGTGEERVFIVRQENNSVFTQPSVSRVRVPNEVWFDWSSKLATLSEWVVLFGAVENTDDALASSADVKSQSLFLLEAAETFRTPAKRKRELIVDEPLADWTVVAHNRSLPIDESVELDDVISTGMGKGILTKIVAKIETSVVALGDAMAEVAVLTHNRFVENEEGANLISGIVQHLKSTVGSAIELDERFEAPTLWGTTAFIADEVTKIGVNVDDVNDDVGVIKKSLAKVIATIQDGKIAGSVESDKVLKVLVMVMSKVKGIYPELESISGRLGVLEAKSVSFSTGAKRQKGADFNGRSTSPTMDHLMMLMDENDINVGESPRLKTPLKSGDETGDGALERDVKRLSVKLETVAADVGLLKSYAEDKSIKFGGLGLRSLQDTHTWVLENFGNESKYGLIMDPLLMLDRIFGPDEVENENQFKSMESQSKLNIPTGAEGAAVKSLQFKRPRLFHIGRVSMKSERNKSKLNRLIDFDAWKGCGDGIRHHIVEQLNLLQAAMIHDIDYALGGDPSKAKAYSVAVSALNSTVTFLMQLFNFVDAIYEKLHLYSKYTAPQGWALTTQILDRICEDLYSPKVGVSTALNMNDPTGVCARILWSCFQTHDVMSKYVEHTHLGRIREVLGHKLGVGKGREIGRFDYECV